jgi:hypothetical protein
MADYFLFLMLQNTEKFSFFLRSHRAGGHIFSSRRGARSGDEDYCILKELCIKLRYIKPGIGNFLIDTTEAWLSARQGGETHDTSEHLVGLYMLFIFAIANILCRIISLFF